MNATDSTIIAGLMSGTSLDGLDIAMCRFTGHNKISYEILTAETIPYPFHWKSRLVKAASGSALELAKLNNDLGCYFGEQLNHLIEKTGIRPQAIASHGHTIFHQPEKGFTLQIGEGSAIAAKTGIITVCDFRGGDVNLGGQGAPLVPLGDATLFPEYSACLNLGGFANISFDDNGKRIAFDICPVNTALNYIAGYDGLAFDEGGKTARKGKLIEDLYDELNSISFYQQPPPKSLGREWFEEQIMPRILRNSTPRDLLHTLCRHIGFQIGKAIKGTKGKMLVTGGGAFNEFLVECIKNNSSLEVIVPGQDLINYKEALIFAWLGHLRLNNRINILSSVTGAKRDSCGGCIYTV